MDRIESIKNELRERDERCREKECCACSQKKKCDEMCYKIDEFISQIDVSKYIEILSKPQMIKKNIRKE